MNHWLPVKPRMRPAIEAGLMLLAGAKKAYMRPVLMLLAGAEKAYMRPVLMLLARAEKAYMRPVLMLLAGAEKAYMRPVLHCGAWVRADGTSSLTPASR